MARRRPPLRSVGSDPDYRFTLANERTFLAWIRTALAPVAGAVALAGLAPDFGPAVARTSCRRGPACCCSWWAGRSQRWWPRSGTGTLSDA